MLLCDLLHETRNSLILATTERDFREGAASLIHHVIKGQDDQNGYGRSWLPGFFIEEDMLLSALSHICVCEKGGASFKEFGPIYLSAVDLVPISLRIHWATFRLDMLHFPTTNGDHSTGDAIKVSEGMGAITIDFESVQVYPTGLVKPDDHYAKSSSLQQKRSAELAVCWSEANFVQGVIPS